MTFGAQPPWRAPLVCLGFKIFPKADDHWAVSVIMTTTPRAGGGLLLAAVVGSAFRGFRSFPPGAPRKTRRRV
jgi:hypothetical protein